MFRIKPFLDVLATSKISIFGAVLVTTAIGADAILIIGELLIFESNPYIGIVAYVLFPGMAAMGLVLIPIGMVLAIRKSHRDPVGKLVRHVRRKHVFRLVFTLTLMNLIVFAFAGYRSIHFMESAEFCGLTCHRVMSPEYTVYQRSSHSQIACVECHVGPGVGWLIKSKLDGTRQLAGVVFDNYARPIETPIHNMRPAKDICGECHSTESYQGNRIKMTERYAPDEKNTRTVSVVNLRLGIPSVAGGELRGIHWHSNEQNTIRFWSSDQQRENVVRVEMVSENKKPRIWTRPGFDGEIRDDHVRVMDCVDCHNRPTHVFLPPEQALNGLLASGKIDAEIPWIRSVAYEVLTEEYATRDEARKGIGNLLAVYQEQHPDSWALFAEPILDAVPVLQELHSVYVYPSMNIQWNTYPSRIGHPTAHTSGCFRCHGGELVDSEGVQITNDCMVCHFVLAEDEQDPIILRLLEDQQ